MKASRSPRCCSLSSPEPEPALHAAGDELRRALKRTRLVFVQRSLETDAVLELVYSGGKALQLDSTELPRAGSPGDVVFVTKIEGLSQQRHGQGAGLGVLREQVHAMLDAGVDVCLVSGLPRIGYPPTPGSSLLLDAHVFQMDSCRRALADDTALDTAALERPPRQAEEVRQLLDRLGLDALSALDRLIFDMGATTRPDSALVAPLEWEALRGSGLVELQADENQHVIRTPLGVLMATLTDVLAENLAVQHDLAHVVVGLTELELRLRRAARAKAIEVFGVKWRAQVFNESLNQAVLERATADAFSPPQSVKSLRDPFEWLSLGELLEVVRNGKWCDRLGLEDRYWRRLGENVLPVRNRVSHMRLLRRGDLDTIRTWCVALSRALDGR